MNPMVAVIILNWNGWKDTIECLESLYLTNYDNYDVVLVDNNSKDDSIDKIKNFCLNGSSSRLESHDNSIKVFEFEEEVFNCITPDLKIDKNTTKLFLLKNSKNYGYAKGNNMGIKFAFRVFNPDYILLLNNDTVVDENFLKELIKSTENQERVGIYSPKLLNADNHKIIDSTGHIIRWGRIIDRGHGKIDKHQYDKKFNVIGAKGAGAFYKSEMLESIGLFKESYVTIYEDAELSWRANKNSWKSIYVPKSIIYHKGERSIKKDNTKWFYFWGLTLQNMTSTVKDYGNIYQKTLFALYLTYLMVGSYLLRIMHIRNTEINYVLLIKKLYR